MFSLFPIRSVSQLVQLAHASSISPVILYTNFVSSNLCTVQPRQQFANQNQKKKNITTFEERPNTSERNRYCDSVHGCFGGRNPSDIYLCWVLWFSVYKREKLSLLCLRRQTTRGESVAHGACGAKLPEKRTKKGGTILYLCGE